MEDISQAATPPPIPVRPGRAVQIRSIESIKPESKPNEYVDTTTINASLNGAPKRPPKSGLKPCDAASLKSKSNTTKDIKVEQRENVTNELREHLQTCTLKSKSAPEPDSSDSQSPTLPPRGSRPPPVPPRDSKNRHCRITIPSATPLALEQPTTIQCNSTISPERPRASSSANSHKLQASVLIITEQQRRFPQLSTASRSSRHDRTPAAVTRQPLASNVTLTLGDEGTVNNTIICPECGQCRCLHCTGNRKLPEQWLCEGNCLCTADSVVDTLSCMCCVKCCFKSCIDNPDGSRVDPCSCTASPKCLLRWTALAAISLCLPCLCCYGPLRLGVQVATACYNSSCCRRQGCCRCDKRLH